MLLEDGAGRAGHKQVSTCTAAKEIILLCTRGAVEWPATSIALTVFVVQPAHSRGRGPVRGRRSLRRK